MLIQANQSLARYTSFGVGGKAKRLVSIFNNQELRQALRQQLPKPYWIIGEGTNILISDRGLPGTTFRIVGGNISGQANSVTAEGGVRLDDVVKWSIRHRLWGLEMLSGVPGTLGAAVKINVNAYGQAIGPRVSWIELVDLESGTINRLEGHHLKWSYKSSPLQSPAFDNMAVFRVGLRLEQEPAEKLEYARAVAIARELGIKDDSLKSRRKIILETRRRSGSIFAYGKGLPKTAGSYFKNPVVTEEQALKLLAYDEHISDKSQLLKSYRTQDKNNLRVSAAHVLMAAGFRRGQRWGGVRLHPDHVLKLENIGNASAQDIFNVAQMIKSTVMDKLGIALEEEVRILGEFNH